MADGRAVMRSSVREFIASEAMYHLGIPTTRALSLVGTGAQVMRDMFYKYAFLDLQISIFIRSIISEPQPHEYSES